MLSEIFVVFVLAVVNGFFALSEMAIVASRKSRLKQMARDSRRARVAVRLSESPERFLSTVQVGITIVILATGAAAGDALGEHFAALLNNGGPTWLTPYARALGWTAGFVLSAFMQIVIGELVPKRAALAAPEKVACAIAIPMLVLSRICLPFVWLVNHASTLILRIFGLHRISRSAASEEEIRMLVAESAEQGVLDADERNMVSRVLRLGDRTVDGVMTPRKRIAWLDIAAPREENIQVMRQTPYSSTTRASVVSASRNSSMRSRPRAVAGTNNGLTMSVKMSCCPIDTWCNRRLTSTTPTTSLSSPR